MEDMREYLTDTPPTVGRLSDDNSQASRQSSWNTLWFGFTFTVKMNLSNCVIDAILLSLNISCSQVIASVLFDTGLFMW